MNSGIVSKVLLRGMVSDWWWSVQKVAGSIPLGPT